MKNVYYFAKKELLESWRTSRIMILLVIFLIFGIMNPLFAKFTPEIMKMAFSDTMQLNIPEPTSLDSWTQFYKNITQMGLIILSLIFGGCVCNEVNKGTLVNLVTKGLKRWVVIFGKLISMVLQWTMCLAVCFLVTFAYTAYYFSDEKSPHIFLAVIPLWVFGVFLCTLILFCSTAARSIYEGLLLTGGGVVVMFIINIFDKTKYANPISLMGKNLEFLQGQAKLAEYRPAMLISILLSVILTYLAVVVMNRKKL